jgi:AcrR family transcriptional regulator
MPRTVSERVDTLPALIEVFREHGYEGTSISLVSEKTGLGKGSLYNFFPGGKEEMARAALAEIEGWFQHVVFEPLRNSSDPREGVERMFDGVVDYFRSGRHACLIGAFALASSRDRFASEITRYFATWRADLAQALTRKGFDATVSEALSEETLAGVQGALVLARALDDPNIFLRTITRLRTRLA